MKKRLKTYFIGILLYGIVLCGCIACSAKKEEPADAVVETKTQEQEAALPTVEEKVSEEKEPENEVAESVEEETETIVEVTKDVSSVEPVLEINGVTIKIGDDLSTLTDKLGDPDDYQAARSCTGEGDEKVYTYGDALVYTTPSDGQDLVYIMELVGEEKLPSGIGVGSTKQEIIDVYGEGYTDDGDYMSYEYDNGNITLGFTLEADVVTFTEIYGTL